MATSVSQNLYDKKFFGDIDHGSRASAVTILSALKRYLEPRSVVDIGCGAGSWVRSAQQVFAMEAACVTGVDGEYAKAFHHDLGGHFVYADLAKSINLPQQFDLAICLEVVEHLPNARAATFVDDLCRLSNVVLFSAAVPRQCGTGHIKEQWPEFWMNEFCRNDYLMFDLIRPEIWNDGSVGPWYAQNCFVFVRRTEIALVDRLKHSQLGAGDWRMRLVHPGILNIAACETAGASRLVRALPGRIVTSFARRFARAT